MSTRIIDQIRPELIEAERNNTPIKYVYMNPETAAVCASEYHGIFIAAETEEWIPAVLPGQCIFGYYWGAFFVFDQSIPEDCYLTTTEPYRSLLVEAVEQVLATTAYDMAKDAQ